MKIRYCLAIILSEYRLQQSSWGEQFRFLNTDVQCHNKLFRLAKIPTPGWRMWYWSYGRYTPFQRGSQCPGSLDKISNTCRLSRQHHTIRAEDCFCAHQLNGWVSLARMLSRFKNGSLHDGIETSTLVFILTFPPLQGQTSVCLYYNPYAYR